MKNQGQALIQAMVIGAIVAGSAVFMTQKQSQVSRVIGSNIVREDLLKVTSGMEQILSSVKACGGDFSSQIGSLVAQADGTTVDLTEVNVGAPYGVIFSNNSAFGSRATVDTDGNQLQGNIIVNDIRLTKVDTNNVNISIDFKINDAKSMFKRNDGSDFILTRSFDLKVHYDDAGNYDTCHLDPSGKVEDAVFRFCQGTGAVYDSETVECRIVRLEDKTCAANEAMVGLDPDMSDPKDPKLVPVCASNLATRIDLECNTAAGEFLKGVNADGSKNCQTLEKADISHLVSTSIADCSSHEINMLGDAGDEKIKISCASSTPSYSLAWVNSPSTVMVDTNINPIVKVWDGASTASSLSSGSVTYTIHTGTGCSGATVATFSGVNFSSGLADGTSSNVQHSSGGSFSLKATSSGTPASPYGTLTAICKDFTITSYELIFSQYPSFYQSGTNFDPEFIVEYSSGNPSSDQNVSLYKYSDASCSTAASGTFSGTTTKTVTTSENSATFSSVAYTGSESVLYVKASDGTNSSECLAVSSYGASGGCSPQIQDEPNRWPLTAYDLKSDLNSSVSITSLGAYDSGKGFAATPRSQPNFYRRTLAYLVEGGNDVDTLKVSNHHFDFPNNANVTFSSTPSSTITIYMNTALRFGITNYFEGSGASTQIQINDNIFGFSGTYLVQLEIVYNTSSCTIGVPCSASLVSANYFYQYPYSSSGSSSLPYTSGSTISGFDWNMRRQANNVHACLGDPCTWNSGSNVYNAAGAYHKQAVDASSCSWTSSTAYHRFINMFYATPHPDQEAEYNYTLNNPNDFEADMNIQYQDL